MKLIKHELLSSTLEEYQLTLEVKRFSFRKFRYVTSQFTVRGSGILWKYFPSGRDVPILGLGKRLSIIHQQLEWKREETARS